MTGLRCLPALRLMTVLVALALAGPAGASGSFPWLPWYPLADDPNLGTLNRIPACTDEAVASNLLGRFNQTEFVYWGGYNNLVAVEGMSESASRERSNDRIARRWCGGTALFADGARRRLVIEMASNAEWLGLTYSLSYCIVGLDRGFVYGRNCETLQKRHF